jgi:hypothetical protein
MWPFHGPLQAKNLSYCAEGSRLYNVFRGDIGQILRVFVG